jgi:tetratricopeptide (TPR) repeat protein
MKIFNRLFLSIILLSLILTIQILPAYAQSKPAGSGAFELALSQYYQKNYQGARDTFLEAVKQNPQDVMSISFYLDSSYKINQLVDAVNKLEQNSISQGDSSISKAQVGIGYISRGFLDAQLLQEALNTLKESLSLNPDLAIANTGMGMVYFHKRLMPRAKGYFIKALKSNPNDLMAIELLGDILMVDEKNPQGALDFYNRLVQLAPTYSDGYFNCGSAYEKLGKKEEAINLFTKCMELDKYGVVKGYHAPIRIGDIYLNDRQYEKAEEYYKIALAMNPDNPLAKTLLKKAQAKGKDWEGTKVNPDKKSLKN